MRLSLPSAWPVIDWRRAPKMWVAPPKAFRIVVVTTATLLCLGLLAAAPPARAIEHSGRFAATRQRSTAGSVFVGSTVPGAAGAEASARLLVAAAGGVPVARPVLGSLLTGGSFAPTDRCPASLLQVSWTPPTGTYEVGAYIAPLGPRPTQRTRRVNGVVLCAGSTHAYIGFEAAWDGTRWRLRAVPALAREEEGVLLAGEAEATGAQPAEVAGTEVKQLPPPSEWTGTPIEPLAAYVPQATCDPTAKPGVLGFRDLLLSTFPGTRNGNIGRACAHIGLSEHKEGRAFDWYVDAGNPSERAAAETVLAWMFATDAEGNSAAIARRLGIMYVIWDGHIWSAFLADEGWRPYVGVNGHTDHLHFSFDWAGAMAQTTFWKGVSVPRAGSDTPDLPLIPVPARAPALPGFGPLVPNPAPAAAPPGPSGPGGPSGAPPPPPADPEPEPPRRSAPPPAQEAPPESTTSTTTTTTAPQPVTVPSTPTTIRIGGASL